jgi:hypothetical protein
MALITHSIVTYQIEVPEDTVRSALIAEALDRHGLTHEGKAIPGVSSKVTFEGRRGSGTFIVHITRDTSKSGQASLPAPERAK